MESKAPKLALNVSRDYNHHQAPTQLRKYWPEMGLDGIWEFLRS